MSDQIRKMFPKLLSNTQRKWQQQIITEGKDNSPITAVSEESPDFVNGKP